MDRCVCWDTTKIIITVEHCPSMNKNINQEVDKIINYTMKGTDLTRFGKAHVQIAHPVQSDGE